MTSKPEITEDLLDYFQVTPLPEYNWAQRPAEIPLTRNEVISALCQSKGNVSDAADLLKVFRARLAAYLKKDEPSKAILDELYERLVDKAESTVINVMEDAPDLKTRLDAAKIILMGSKAGKNRGWGEKGVMVDLNLGPGGRVAVRWANEQEAKTMFDPANEIPLIENHKERIIRDENAEEIAA